MEDAHTKHNAAFAAATRRHSANTTVIVLSILLAVALVVLAVMVWIHFSPLLLHTASPTIQQPFVQHHHW